MPPITFKELLEKQKQGTDLYSNRDLKSLSQLPGVLFRTLQKAPGLKRGTKLEIQDAIHVLINRDPQKRDVLTEQEKKEKRMYPERKTRPLPLVNRDKLENAICTLEGLGDFLGAAGPENYGNVYQYLLAGTDEPEILQEGLRIVNNVLNLGIPFDDLEKGMTYAADPGERHEREERKRQIQEEQEARRQKYEEAEQEIAQEKLARIKKAREAEEREARELAEKTRKKIEEEEKKQARRKQEQEEAQKSAEQRQREEESRKEKARQKELQHQQIMRTSMETSILQYRRADASPETKKMNMAMAAAFHAELARVGGTGEIPMDTERVRREMDAFFKSALFAKAEAEGTLDTLTELEPEDLVRQIAAKEQEVQKIYQEGTDRSRSRADKLFRQFDRTWRIKKNSTQYDKAREAMQRIAGKKTPATRGEHYVAADAVMKYVAKNINKAKSEVGRERMSISLAFLKQTMLPERFRAYCANLNAQRGIPQNDVTNERYIDPRTIGTVNEVYEETRERIRKVTEREDGAKPDPRDLAMLTALSRLSQRGGGDKAVEQGALQEEIGKVQSSPQFQRAMQRDSADELIRKAFYGSLKSLDGYEKPAPSGPVAEDPAQVRL